jgi:hypothetical protein
MLPGGVDHKLRLSLRDAVARSYWQFGEQVGIGENTGVEQSSLTATLPSMTCSESRSVTAWIIRLAHSTKIRMLRGKARGLLDRYGCAIPAYASKRLSRSPAVTAGRFWPNCIALFRDSQLGERASD